MMPKNYLNYLISKCKKFTKKHNIFDVVLYGSAVKGKDEPGDIDLLIIFLDKSLEIRTKIAQEMKKIIKKEIKNIDVKTITLKELFDKDLLARQGIFTEGISMVHNIPFSKRLGFEGYTLFTYNLSNLGHNEKTKFTYALIGRNKDGMIKKLEAIHLGRGVLIIPTKNSIIFKKFFEKWNINFKTKDILVSTI